MTSERPPDGGQRSAISFLGRAFATGLFVGYVPWASGTFGAAVGVLAYLIPGAENPSVLLVMTMIGLVVGIPAAHQVAIEEGHRLTRSAELAKSLFQPGAMHAPDPSIVVIDEIVGMWVSLLWLPKSLPAVLLAFLLFRIFDVMKPEPARMVERLPYGIGIMFDDVVAGLYANLGAHALLYIFTLIAHGAG